MACSVDSVSAAASGRGVRGCSLPAGYKLLLPTLPSDETMKLCVFLHCDVGGRPYRIKDFRSPLEELGVLKAVSGIGPFQLSHVWMLKLRSQEEKNLLISSGGLKVKGRYCAVIDPVKQELTVKIHWVAFDVPNEAIRSVLSEYGDVKDVRQEEWRVPGFEQAESTTRAVRTPPASQHLEERRCETVADGCAETAQSEESPAPRSGTRPKKTRPTVLTGERESTEIDGGASFELTEQGKEANKLEEACLGASAEMDVDPALLKRRHEEDDGARKRLQQGFLKGPHSGEQAANHPGKT
ncbi:hypothetical protein HPB50_017593 [Hyalomma asiaticum]|uniref:Uncharacterized protein n=1 Tax=Hyalomma asiaticum TaxID=266040 RepID=A0ACB7TI31_HYAAI|nr:hypothetical protein HPB50_017593 [Hyalomma asiaticum]